MNILITGASGFVGRNLCATLHNIKENKDRTRPGLAIGDIYEYDVDSTVEELDEYCAKADFVFNLAGVNRPVAETEEERAKLFKAGNFGFASTLLDTLKKHGNTCPVMLSSSIQASLEGRYAGSDYGKSKLAGEELFFNYGRETGAKVLIYRFPNLFGKWCRPNYNSAVATFCYNIAHDLPIQVNDRSTELELLYIDDLVSGLVDALENRETYERVMVSVTDGANTGNIERYYAKITPTHTVTLGEIVDFIETFHNQPESLMIPEIPEGSFAKKLYSTYLSYLPADKVAYDLNKKTDDRGSFTELIKTVSGGQFSVNVSKPGITKGNHWHHSKWEIFIVVSGEALIKMKRTAYAPRLEETDDIIEIHASGDHPQAIHMLPGYAHSITNLSDTQDLITLMWANESFNQDKPDTYSS